MLAREDRQFRRFRRTGDADALAEVFDRTAPELTRLARLLVGADTAAAEDLVQRTFVDAIEHADRYDEARRIRPWLCGLLANHARRHRRAVGREADALRRAAERADHAAGARSADELAAESETVDWIRRSIDGVAEPYATVLRLHLEEGLNAKQIAARLDRPTGTVRTQLVRALARLRRRLPAAVGGTVVLSATPPLAELAALRRRVVEVARLRAPHLSGALGTAGASLAGVLIMKKILAVASLIAAALVGWAALGFPGVRGPNTEPVEQEGARATVAADPERAGPEPSVPTRVPVAEPSAVEVPTRAVDGRVVLRVVEADRTPVAGQPVSIRVADRLTARALTDAAGHLEVAALPDDAVVQAGSAREIAARLATAADGARVLVLPVGRRVTGRVVDAEGRPVTDAEILARHWGGQNEPLDPIARSDAAGAFAVTAPATGTVAFEIHKEGYAPAGTGIVPIGTDDLVVRLITEGRRLRGQILDPAGQPVPFCRVSVAMLKGESRNDRFFDATIDADADGRFDVGWLPVGAGVVTATDLPRSGPDAACAWVAFATFDLDASRQQDVTLRGGTPGEISVRVLDASDAPVADARVDATHPDASFTSAEAPLRAEARTDADGRAQLGPLAPGRFRVHTRRGQLTLDDEVLVRSGAVADVVLRWPEEAPGVDVELVDPRGLPLAGWSLRASGGITYYEVKAVSDDEGRARLSGLDPDRTYVLEVLHDGQPVARRTGIDSQSGLVRITFDPAKSTPGTLFGRVVADDPVRGTVNLSPAGGGLTANAQLADDGAFRFRPLPAGEYRLYLQADAHVLAPLRITVPPGGTVDLGELTAERGATLTIRIPGLTATEAQAMRVYVGPAEDSMSLTRDPATPDGWGSFRPLPAGAYRVTVLGTDTVPLVREVELAPGPNRVDLEQPARGSPIRLEIRFMVEPPGGWTGIANGIVRIRDAAGEPVASERFFGHFDDFDAHLVVRRFALAPGRYEIEASDFRHGTKATFELGASPAPKVIALAVE